jgi:predicted SAM-dependent methyltransferase
MQLNRFSGKPIKVVVGAAGLSQPSWIPTEIGSLDLTNPNDFRTLFGGVGRIDAIFAEHVWEHLDEQNGRMGFQNCFDYLKPGAYLRIAVPDGFHPDPAYIDYVRPGGSGIGADDHKVLYTVESLTLAASDCGFECIPLEHWDRLGQFHEKEWNPEGGLVQRSKRFDERNAGGELKYTSLIMDAFKPRR